MEAEYSKKDISKSPKAKKVENVLPDGWQLYLKRGVWCVRDDKNVLSQHKSEQDAWKFING